MFAHTVETLQARYDLLEQETAFEDWRRLAKDILSALVEQQGLVISMQRRALDVGTIGERAALRVRADAAFVLVQRLHQLRRRVHGLLVEQQMPASRALREVAIAASGQMR